MAVPKQRTRFTRFPVVSLSAECLTMGYLLRRNVLAYKAPPGNEGYDLICVHPNPRHAGRQIRVQVKSRLATDCDRAFPVREESLDAFDFLIVVFLNVGFFQHRAKGKPAHLGATEPEFYTLPAAFVQEHHVKSGVWQKVRLKGHDLSGYRDEAGFELIAAELDIAYPSK